MHDARPHAHTHACTHTDTHTHTHAHIHTHTQAHTRTHAHTHACTHTHVVYVFACVCVRILSQDYESRTSVCTVSYPDEIECMLIVLSSYHVILILHWISILPYHHIMSSYPQKYKQARTKLCAQMHTIRVLSTVRVGVGECLCSLYEHTSQTHRSTSKYGNMWIFMYFMYACIVYRAVAVRCTVIQYGTVRTVFTVFLTPYIR